MSENGAAVKPVSSPSPAPAPSADPDVALEMIPESKKEDSPDRMPLQRPADPVAKPESKLPSAEAAKADSRVQAACELPLAVAPAQAQSPPASVENNAGPKEPESVPEPPEKAARTTISASQSPEPSGKGGKKQPNAKAKASSRRSSRKGSASCKEGSVTTEKKPSLYEKALKEFQVSRSKRLLPKSGSKTLGKGKPGDKQPHESSISEEYQTLFYQLRDSLLGMQKKDAVTRQAVEKLQKEGQQLEEERGRKEIAIAKFQKTRSADGTIIAKQEELIAKLRIDQQAAERTSPPPSCVVALSENSPESKPGKARLESCMQDHIRLQSALSAIQTGTKDLSQVRVFPAENLEELVATENIREISQLVTNMCESCDRQLEQQEAATKAVKEQLLSVRKETMGERSRVDNALVALKHERILDQKKILDLQRRLGFAMEEYEQDKTKLVSGDSLMGVDLNSEENRMKGRADDIMVALKDRIVAASKDNVAVQADPETNRFINRISMSTSPKGSIESPRQPVESTFAKMSQKVEP